MAGAGSWGGEESDGVWGLGAGKPGVGMWSGKGWELGRSQAAQRAQKIAQGPSHTAL